RREASRAGFDAECVSFGNARNGLPHSQVNASQCALREQHGNDRTRRAVAEQLTQRLFMKWNAMTLNEIDEVGLRIAAERRSAKNAGCPTESDRARCQDW